ncbi:hypothetical protein GCM10027429_11150 [Marivirga atlantica]|jgi:rRNA maturation endonuclease Nob1|nr:hypothetical protein [Marivirga atlantica]
MIGAGFIADMAKKMKQNSALLRRKSYFEMQKESNKKASHQKIKIPKASPEQLKKYKAKAHHDNKNGLTAAILKTSLIVIFILAFGLLCVILISKRI